MTYTIQKRGTSVKFLRNKSHNLKKITQLEHKKLKHLWDDCGRAFLKAIALSDIIAMDTGMSKASLLPLARYLRMYTEVRSSIRPTRGTQKGSFSEYGTWRPNVDRSIATGEAASTRKAGFNVLYGSPKRMVFIFDFEIKVWQYLIYEEGFKSAAAWRTIDVGRKAFVDHLEENLKLFDLTKWGIHVK